MREGCVLYLLITMRQIIGNYLRYSGRHSAKSDNKQTGKGKGGVGFGLSLALPSQSQGQPRIVLSIYLVESRLDQKFNNCTLMYLVIHLPSRIAVSVATLKNICNKWDKFFFPFDVFNGTIRTDNTWQCIEG